MDKANATAQNIEGEVQEAVANNARSQRLKRSSHNVYVKAFFGK
ncbi:hypothetical protein [Tumidithrix helvetica]